MAIFEVNLRNGTVETIESADAYQPDGQLTTFFAFEDGRSTIDCWSLRGGEHPYQRDRGGVAPRTTGWHQ